MGVQKVLMTAGMWVIAAMMLLNAQPNLVTNGSFEVPTSDNRWQQNPATWFAGQIFGGWTVTQGSIDINRAGIPPVSSGVAYGGAQFVDLNGSFGIGGISQTVTVPSNGLYRLSFALSANTAEYPNVDRTVRVTLTGANFSYYQDFTWRLADHPNHASWSNLRWDYHEIQLSLNAGSYALSFVSLTDEPCRCAGPLIDDVQLVPFCLVHNGDVDSSGCVDDADLLAVLFAFGSSGQNLGRVDVNCDGTVDDADLLQVLFNFGSGC